LPTPTQVLLHHRTPRLPKRSTGSASPCP